MYAEISNVCPFAQMIPVGGRPGGTESCMNVEVGGRECPRPRIGRLCDNPVHRIEWISATVGVYRRGGSLPNPQLDTQRRA